MKRFFLAISLIPFLLSGCGGSSDSSEPVVEHSINVPINDVSLVEGSQFEIPIEIIKKTIVICKSNNEEIVTVSRDGVITALKEGETTISVSGGQDHFIVFVTVLPDTAKSSLQIVMPKNEFTLEIGDEYVLPLTVKYGNEVVNNPLLSYTYEVENIVSISSLIMTAKNEGTTKCVVTASLDELEVSESFTVTVY